ncbi:CvpA family protein [Formosa algae]|uniref:Membrane protein required for colicin V production n=1 Tax=Formosa algae TaxID=225843 RepID=A0A9X0YK97_9FLAO|nr:CvpA family protein [Formosa algae]MBP1838463.1 membrane protein required for colicin V production [Formosa algae]MDQ0334598.1 membrane protein required for colicin V production [Formosa algae]OEI79133.1 colicin V production protein [Formosa algae]PNW30176.1 colicin V production protein [Formosa algae]
MTLLDIILAVILLFGLVRGFINGLFVEIASLLALIIGVFGAIHFSAYTGSLFEDKVDWDDNYIKIVAFAVTFIAIVLVIGLAGRALTKLADFAFLGIVNKILGGVFGLLKIGLIASVALNIFVTLNDTVPFVDETDIDDSVLYEPVMAISTKLYPAIKEKVEEKKKDLLTKDEEEN